MAPRVAPSMPAAVLAVALAACLAAAHAQYLVGFANRDITPTQQQLDSGEIWLGGYGFWKGRGRPTGVHDPVWARAFVVEANGTAVANCVLDLPGIANGALKEIRQGVEAGTAGAIRQDAVLISSTHTHAGPDLQGLWGGVSANYRRQVIDWTVAAIVEAYNERRPARVFLTVGTAQANNRRGWGYTDTDVTILDAFDAETNLRFGTVVNFAAHPVTLDSDNLLVSSDFCHYLRINAEAALNATVIYVNGIQGDVNARGTGSSFAKAESYGIELANAVVAALPASEEVLGTAQLSYKTSYFRHPVTNLAFLAAFRVGLLPDYDINDDNTLDLQVTYFRLGAALQGVAFPGESLTRNGLPVKEAMTSKYRMFLGLMLLIRAIHQDRGRLRCGVHERCGAWPVNLDEWESGRNGGYEESVSIDQFVGDTARDLLISMVEEDNEKFSI